jgi:hypothetical protein
VGVRLEGGKPDDRGDPDDVATLELEQLRFARRRSSVVCSLRSAAAVRIAAAISSVCPPLPATVVSAGVAGAHGLLTTTAMGRVSRGAPASV